MLESIRAAGFDVGLSRLHLSVEGLHCAGCVTKIESAVRDRGVGGRTVNLGRRGARRAVTGRGGRGGDRVIVGAGPSGLAAAIVLAGAGERVRVLERRPDVGWRFAGDFQGLENWTTVGDVLSHVNELGIRSEFDHLPVREVTFYDDHLRPAVLRSREPLFYLVRRGPAEGSLDRALLEQAQAAGVEVCLGERVHRAEPGWIVATGPQGVDCIAHGYVFPTDLLDQARAIISRDITPFGYAYLLVWRGQATLAACSLESKRTRPGSRARAAAAFARVVPGLELERAKAFSGRGHLLGRTHSADAAGRLYVGEAAGLQDPVWGFGLRYALESGALAARCLLEGAAYDAEVRALLEPNRSAGFLNRQVFRLGSGRATGPILRRIAASGDAREVFSRYCGSGSAMRPRLGRVIGTAARRERQDVRDLSCGASWCRCLRCRCLAGENRSAGHQPQCCSR